MVRSRISLIAVGACVFLLGACGSDEPSTKNSTTTTATTVAGSSVSSVTSTTGVGGVTTPTATPPATNAPGVTTVPSGGSTASTAVGATTTTAKARVVTAPDDNVKLGDSGDGVKKIQFALLAKGYKVTVDGDFGNQTDAAVRQFQQKNKLKVDGIVGKVTWTKLSAADGTTTTVKGGSSATTTTVK